MAIDKEKLKTSLLSEIKRISLEDIYFDDFYSKQHHNCILENSTSPYQLCVLSVLKVPNSRSFTTSFHKAMITSPQGYQELVFEVPLNEAESDRGMKMYIKKQIHGLGGYKLRCFVLDENFRHQLVLLEKEHSQKINKMKVGLLYVKAGQTTLEQWFQNSKDLDPRFWELVDVLGERKQMAQWTGYQGDVRKGMALYTVWHDVEVVYHLGPELSPEEIRRLIGNDIVQVIYSEAGPIDLELLLELGQVTQAYLVVTPENEKYKAEFYQRSALTAVGPSFELALDIHQFKELLLTRAYNALLRTRYCPPMNRLFYIPRQEKLRQILDPFMLGLCEFGVDPTGNFYLENASPGTPTLLLKGNKLSSIKKLTVTNTGVDSFDFIFLLRDGAHVKLRIHIDGLPHTSQTNKQITTSSRDENGRIIVLRKPDGSSAKKETVIIEGKVENGCFTLLVSVLGKEQSGPNKYLATRSSATLSTVEFKNPTVNTLSEATSFTVSGIPLAVGENMRSCKFVESYGEQPESRPPIESSELTKFNLTTKVKIKQNGRWKNRTLMVDQSSPYIYTMGCGVFLDFSNTDFDVEVGTKKGFDINFRFTPPVRLRFDTQEQQKDWERELTMARQLLLIVQTRMTGAPTPESDWTFSSLDDEDGIPFYTKIQSTSFRNYCVDTNPDAARILDTFQSLYSQIRQKAPGLADFDFTLFKRLLSRTSASIIFGDYPTWVTPLLCYVHLFIWIYRLFLRYSNKHIISTHFFGRPTKPHQFLIYSAFKLANFDCLPLPTLYEFLESQKEIWMGPSTDVSVQKGIQAFMKEILDPTIIPSVIQTYEQYFTRLGPDMFHQGWKETKIEASNHMIGTTMGEVVNKPTVVFVTDLFGTLAESVGSALQNLAEPLQKFGVQIFILAKESDLGHVSTFSEKTRWNGRVFFTADPTLLRGEPEGNSPIPSPLPSPTPPGSPDSPRASQSRLTKILGMKEKKEKDHLRSQSGSLPNLPVPGSTRSFRSIAGSGDTPPQLRIVNLGDSVVLDGTPENSPRRSSGSPPLSPSSHRVSRKSVDQTPPSPRGSRNQLTRKSTADSGSDAGSISRDSPDPSPRKTLTRRTTADGPPSPRGKLQRKKTVDSSSQISSPHDSAFGRSGHRHSESEPLLGRFGHKPSESGSVPPVLISSPEDDPTKPTQPKRLSKQENVPLTASLPSGSKTFRRTSSKPPPVAKLVLKLSEDSLGEIESVSSQSETSSFGFNSSASDSDRRSGSSSSRGYNTGRRPSRTKSTDSPHGVKFNIPTLPTTGIRITSQIYLFHPEIGLIDQIPAEKIDLVSLLRLYKRNNSVFIKQQYTSAPLVSPSLSIPRNNFQYLLVYPNKLTRRKYFTPCCIYRDIMSKTEHLTLLGYLQNGNGPFVITMEVSKLCSRHALLWTSTSQEYILVPHPESLHTRSSLEFIFQKVSKSGINNVSSVLSVTDPLLPPKLLKLEQQLECRRLNVGLFLFTGNASTQDLTEEKSSPFLLDIIEALTGSKKLEPTYSITHQGYQARLSVANAPNSDQQGVSNSPFMIVLRESEQPFDPSSMSTFQHAALILSKTVDDYHIEYVSRGTAANEDFIVECDLNSKTIGPFLLNTICLVTKFLFRSGPLKPQFIEIRQQLLSGLLVSYDVFD